MPTALITGASSGIGRATALRLASSGWSVFAGVRDPAAGERLASDGGERVIPIQLEVTDAAQIERAAATIGERDGRLDALVNNAGIGVSGPLETVSEDDLRRQFDVNVFGQIAVTRAMLPALRSARGRIVFVSSLGGRVTMPFTGPYGASKHAIEAFADALRGELHSSKVRVVLIEPGSVATPIWDKTHMQAEQLTVPSALQGVYGDSVVAVDKAFRQTARRGVPPEQVAHVIERALTSSRIRARYVVGRDAKVMLLMKRALPDRAFDRLARRVLGI